MSERNKKYEMCKWNVIREKYVGREKKQKEHKRNKEHGKKGERNIKDQKFKVRKTKKQKMTGV